MNRSPARPIYAALGAVLLIVAAVLAVTLGATSATAHTGAVQGTATCETDGTFTVQWTYTAANVPDGVEAETKAMTTSAGHLTPGPDGVDKGGQIYLSVWTEHQVNVPGAPVRTGNWSAGFRTVGIPATATSVTTMVQTDWNGGPSEDPVGEVTLPGGCTTPTEPPPTTPPTSTPPPTTPPTSNPPTTVPPTTVPPTSTPPTSTPPTEQPPTEEPPTPPSTPPTTSSYCLGAALVVKHTDGHGNSSTSTINGAKRCETKPGQPPVKEEGF